MTELAAARAEVEAAAMADAMHVVAVELEALRGSSISNSVSVDGGTDDELKLAREAFRLGREDVPRVAPTAAPPATRSWHETTPATTVANWRSWLCSWHTQASSYLQRHRPQRLSSTLMSREHTPSSAMAPATTRLTCGASTPAPPIT
jgi:hypothetical protein